MKFYRHLKTAGALSALVIIPACAEEGTKAPSDGPGIAIEIAPVTYNGATDVCYGIHVANATGQTVVLLEGICSSDYGNGAGGDLAYVAPCDASGTGSSTVTLWLESIEILGGGNEPESAYINPCGLEAETLDANNVAGDGSLSDGFEFPAADQNFDGFACTRTITCQPNADVRVAFDITVMRDAQQGFFDIVVDFEDIFCSAKIDTCYAADGKQISLLLDQDNPVGPTPRDETAVLALACSAGPDTNAPNGNISTTLHFTNVAIMCDDGIAIPLDMTGGVDREAGNQAATQYVQITNGVPGELTTLASPVHYALYWGAESLPCGQSPTGVLSCNKKYWNVAVNLEDLAELGFDNCVLQAGATATGSDSLQLVNGGLDGEGVVYPVIVFQESILEEGGATCDWNPINGENSDLEPSAVQTGYFGTGDSSAKLFKEVFCYNKNSTEDGRPWHTAFVDRYNSIENAQKLGRLGREWKGDVGGARGKNCYKGTPANNVVEAAEWTVAAGEIGAEFWVDKANEGYGGINVAVYGASATGWEMIGNALTLEGMVGRPGQGAINISTAGFTKLGLAVTATELSMARTFTIHSLARIGGEDL